MKKSRISKGLVAFYMIATLVVIGSKTSTIAQANNYTDTAFSFNYNGDGSDVTTIARSKTDNTYTYVRSSTNSNGTMNVAAEAKAGITSGQYGDPFGYTYCTSWYQIISGNRKYFPNSAHSLGYSATYLAISSADHLVHHFEGVWSPDNISGYGNP